MNFVRWLFIISLAIGIFWMLGFVIEYIYQKDPAIFILFLLSISITTVFIISIFITFPNFLKDFPESYISSAKYYFTSIIISYFILVPIFATIAYAAVRLFGNIQSNETSIFIALSAIWFPIWWMVPIGLTVGWILYKRKCFL